MKPSDGPAHAWELAHAETLDDGTGVCGRCLAGRAREALWGFLFLLYNGKLAELHLRRAISIRPIFTLAVNDLGNVFAEQARWEEASAQFAKALEIDPGFVPAREALRQVQSILSHQQK